MKVKKALVTMMLLLASLIIKAQIPLLNSNTTESQKINSLAYTCLNGKYDFIIACTRQSYWWSNRKFYSVLAYLGDHWEKISISSKRSKKGKWSKPEISRTSFDEGKVKELLEVFNKNDFWHLTNDSLNISGNFGISDAVNYEFEVIEKDKFRVIESYAPEYFLEKMPEIKCRERFLKCRDIFYSVYNSRTN